MPWRLTRPYVGHMPTTPLTAAGSRMEPPVSDPSAAYTARAPTATPDPLDEPHGMCSGFHGFRHCSRCALKPCGPMAHSTIASPPRWMAPAAAILSITVAVYSGRKSLLIFEPQVAS